MQTATMSRARADGAFTPAIQAQPRHPDRLLTTGQVATLTTMSESWLCKGRVYGWGPKYIRFGTSEKGGAIRYRWSDILLYVERNVCDPEAGSHD
ncbi:hypothetical protein DEM25_004720 [Oceaniradius stylonematis]|uniref:DNA-binding protein n=2 Tax=Oceaniradius stylonematis TaxID=2184161 RepID=A0A3A8AMP2_9HYPH|nr:hypothetical protein DEM25_004720 [Oceaniradius stylonematis]